MRCQKCELTNSPTARFCKQCGTPLPRDEAAFPAAQQPCAVEPVEPCCPQCATPRVGGKRFCRQCRFDYSTLDASDAATQTARATPLDPDADADAAAETETAQREAEELAAAREAAQQAAAREAERRAGEERRVAEERRAAEERRLAEERRAAEERHIAEERRAAEERRLAEEQAAAEATRAAEQRAANTLATEAQPASQQAGPAGTCPQCSTVRVADKRFCRSCRFDFVERNAPVAAPAAAVDETGDARQSVPAASPADEPAQVNVAESSDAHPTSPAADAPYQPQVPVATQAARKANKPLIVGVSAVLVLGIALGAGLYIRSQHAARANDDALDVGASSAASSGDASSGTPVASPAPDRGSASEPATQSASNEPANVVDTASASLPAVDATPIPAAPGAQPSAPPSPTLAATGTSAQTQTQTPNPTSLATAPAPAPDAPSLNAPHDVAAALNAPSPHVKPPRKPSTPPAGSADDGQNATIRAAISGSLADGNGCFGNKKYDCAISNADAVLRLDPRNSAALSLRRRAKTAQDDALNSLSIQ